MEFFKNRQTVLFITIILMSAFIFSGCEKDDSEDFLGSINVQLVLKEGLSDISLNNVNVSIINTQDNTERKALTDLDGNATFAALPAGTYNLNISEPREDGEYILSGTFNNIVVSMKEETNVRVTVEAVISNAGLVIKEIYYLGADDKHVTLYKDQFIEIFNNSAETIYADGLYVGHLYPDKWNRTMPQPFSEMLDIENFCYLDWIYRIPGNGKDYPIEPSKSIVIALNAINLKEGNPSPDKAVDNSGADFQISAIEWLDAQGRKGNSTFDINNPDVPNVEPIYLGYLDFFLMNTYGPALVIFRREEDFSDSDVFNFSYVNKKGKDEEDVLMKVPTSLIIDGVEIMFDSTLGEMKKLPAKIDASFTYAKADGGAVYSGLSLRRKIDEQLTSKFGRVVLQDLNNSFADFEVIEYPDPRGYDNL